jgi:RND family efflux transporter MFP subunit
MVQHTPVRAKAWLAMLCISVLVNACGKIEPSAEAQAAIPVKTETLSSGKVQDISEFVGTLEAVTQAIIKPEIQGQIEKILVKSGDRVKQGTPMMTLRPDRTAPDFETARVGAINARTAREAAVREREVAVNEVATAQSDLELAETNFGRAKYLLVQGAIGKFTYDQAKNNLDVARNRLKSAKERLQVAEVGIKQADGNIRQAQAQADAAKVSVDFKQIVAPIGGIIGDIAVKVGDYVTIGETISIITQNNALDLRLSIPANNIPKLRAGLPVELSDPNTKQKIATGNINFISPNVNPQAQSVLVKARFSNPSGNLKNGQFVQAKVIWAQSPGILVPVTAVSRTGGQGFVFVVNQTTKDGQTQTVVEQRPVKLGTVQGDRYEIVSGVKPGEQVAVSNILKLRNGVSVQPQS